MPKAVERIQYPIVCPYCYAEFAHDKVHFRAPENRHWEPVDGSASQNGGENYGIINGVKCVENSSAVTDEKLTRYREKYRNGDRAALAPAIDPSTGVADVEGGFIGCRKVEYNNNGVLYKVLDEFGNASTERICPSCHNVLPKSAGNRKSCIIAFLGDTSVGKTVYMTTLINTLQKEVAMNFNATCYPLDNNTLTNYMEYYYTPMYKMGQLPTPTMANTKMEPLIFELNIGQVFKSPDKTDWEPEHSATLAFFDIAGEGIKARDYLEVFGKHLRYADAYIFLVDPLQTSIAARIEDLTGVKDANERGEAMEVIQSLVSNDAVDKNKLTAVVLTKSDLLKKLEERFIHPNSNIFLKTHYENYLDYSVVDAVNTEVTSLFKEMKDISAHYVKLTFPRHRFFAVSALGGQPVEAGGKKQIPGGRPDPCRVEEPFLWILCELGYIPSGPPPEKKKWKWGGLFNKR